MRLHTKAEWGDGDIQMGGGKAVEETEMTMVVMMGGEPFWRVRGTDKKERGKSVALKNHSVKEGGKLTRNVGFFPPLKT